MKDRNGRPVELGSYIIVSRGSRGNSLIRAKVVEVREKLLGPCGEAYQDKKVYIGYYYNPTINPAGSCSGFGYVKSPDRFLVAQ